MPLDYPTIPLNTSSRQLVDFCLFMQSVPGFIRVYEEKFAALEVQRRTGKRSAKGAAYEETEQLYVALFGRRRYGDQLTFFDVLSRHRNK